MKRLVVFLVPLLLLAFLVAGCRSSAYPPAASHEVQMDHGDFLQHSLTIKVGEAVHFNDLTGGGTHIICVGENGICSNDANAPQELHSDGFQIEAGQARDVVFAEAGTYKVTCSIHPRMNLIVTVE